MVIGIHAQAAFRQQRTGVEEYLYRLLESWARDPDAMSGHRLILYKKSPAPFPAPAGLFLERTLRAPFVWTQSALALECMRRPPDVLFVPSQIPPVLSRVKMAVTIHGVEFARFPQFYPRAQRQYLWWGTRAALRKAAHVIAVSESTKQDLIEIFGCEPERITTVPHGVKKPLVISSVKPFPAPFFIFVGRIELKKNVDGIVRAFEEFKRITGSPHRLLLTGTRGFGAESIGALVNRSPWRHDIEWRGYVSDHEKWQLLRAAEALVFPSWYEGFGLPILEAQAAGIPVITSNVSSMPEIAGAGALLVNPASSSEIAAALMRVAHDRAQRDTLIEKGFANCGRFSWEQCAHQTLAVVTNIG